MSLLTGRDCSEIAKQSVDFQAVHTSSKRPKSALNIIPWNQNLGSVSLCLQLIPRPMVELIKSLIDFILHIDTHLVEIIRDYKTWTYIIIFLIIFAETGLVVTPFLPGDSLLFALGAIIAKPETDLNIFGMLLALCVAAILGDLVNYHVGKWIGYRAFSGKYKLLKVEYLEKTQAFYNKHGGKTIIYARFIPIIRTFAPFIAGMGTMNYGRFALYNVAGGVAWVSSFLFLGYFFGGIPVIKQNFTLVILGIIIVSILPPIIEVYRSKRKSKQA
jgi:membrane-associated protein